MKSPGTTEKKREKRSRRQNAGFGRNYPVIRREVAMQVREA
jgi:hypothetical protein